MKTRIAVCVAFVLSLVSGFFVFVPQTSAQAPAPTATVRVAHASPTAPAVDVYVDGNRVLAGMNFFQASGYLTIPAGNRLVQVTAANAAPSTAVISATVPFTASTVTTIAAVGLFGQASPPAGQEFGVRTFSEDLTAPTGTNAHVRVYHLSPDAPAVGVRVAGSSTPLIASLSYGNASSLLPVPAGSYDLEVFAVAAPTTPITTIRGVILEPGKIYDVFATGQATTTPPTLTFRSQATTPGARVRVMHASPNAPAVDVWVGGQRALQGLSFFQSTGYLDLPAGTALPVQVTPAGVAPTPATAVISTSLTFAPGQAYSVAAIGLLGNGVPSAQQFRATVINEDLSPPRGLAKVRAYHFSPDTPAVDILVQGQTTPIVSNLAFGRNTEFFYLPAASYTLIARPSGQTILSFPLGTFNLEAGKIYDLLATGTFATLTPQALITDAKLRAIHASPDTPAVDIYANAGTSPLLPNVSFFAASPYLAVNGGENSFSVTPAGQPRASAPVNTLVTTEMGRAYTLAAIGLSGATPPTLQARLYVDDLSMTQACNTRVRVYHFSPDAPAVDVRAVGVTAPLISNLAFGAASNTLNVPGGLFNLQVTPAGQTTPVVVNLPNTLLMPGRSYSVFATNVLASIKPEVSLLNTGGSGGCVNYLPVISK